MKVSNPDKVLFPERGITKGEVVAHYEAVADRMMPWLAGRPVTIERFPSGIGRKGFLQKNAADHYPASIERYEVPKQEGGVTTYPVLRTAEDVAYLANQNTVTFHAWSSTVDDPGRPDWFILDLDPSEGDLGLVRRAAHLTREVLGRFGLEALVVATGSKGFHLRVPIVAEHGFEAVDRAGRAAAGLVVLADPAVATVEFLKRERGGRVFVDWLRNGPIATSVVPWSLRPRPEAPVAVPLGWSELDEARPDGFTLGHLADRLARPDQLPPPQPLPVAELEAAAADAGVDLATTVDRFGRRR